MRIWTEKRKSSGTVRVERMSPSQTYETREATVRSDPFTSGLNSQRGVVGIAYEIASRRNTGTEITENRPVIGARRNDCHVGMVTQLSNVSHGFRQGGGRIKNLWMCQDAQTATEHQFRNSASLEIIVKVLLQPRSIFGVRFHILPMSIDQDVHIQKNHRSSMTSSRPAVLSRSTPGRRPFPLNVGSRVGSVRETRGLCDRHRRSASSMTLPSVSCRSSANRFALRNNSSCMFTVVLMMHHNISAMHHDVKDNPTCPLNHLPIEGENCNSECLNCNRF